MTPFVLKGCTKLPAEPEPCWDHVFDRQQQIWVSKTSERAVILDMQRKTRARECSQFGETTVTRSEGEGHDPSGASTFEASQFGETTVTKADGEGVDILALDTRAAIDGLKAWHDPALWHRAKQEISPAAAPMYGELVAPLLAAKQGPSFRDYFVSNLMLSFSDADHAAELASFAPVHTTSGGRAVAARAQEAILIDAEFKARALPAIDDWIKRRSGAHD